jgi:hypothetical protein
MNSATALASGNRPEARLLLNLNDRIRIVQPQYLHAHLRANGTLGELADAKLEKTSLQFAGKPAGYSCLEAHGAVRRSLILILRRLLLNYCELVHISVLEFMRKRDVSGAALGPSTVSARRSTELR